MLSDTLHIYLKLHAKCAHGEARAKAPVVESRRGQLHLRICARCSTNRGGLEHRFYDRIRAAARRALSRTRAPRMRASAFLLRGVDFTRPRSRGANALKEPIKPFLSRRLFLCHCAPRTATGREEGPRALGPRFTLRVPFSARSR